MEKNACPRDIKEGKSITYDKINCQNNTKWGFLERRHCE